ncbi:STM3941 family protein [Sphingomonas sp. MS122]|uniref:STM3941 family protein n=1 Tax=Sphingomonas sp. MS122 TaxID=3412683 RepID=UPI003C2B6ECD
MSERFVAHVSKGKTLGLTLISVGFVAIGIWLIVNPEEAASRRLSDPAMVWGFGWLAILVFGGFAVVGVRQVFRAGPVMEIDSRGILWRRWSDQVIPWSAIVRVEKQAIQYNKFLCLWLDVPEHYPGGSTLGKLSGVSKFMGGGDITLSVAGTDQGFDRLVEVVDAHLRARDQRVGTGSAPE